MTDSIVPADVALSRLLEGNRRVIDGTSATPPLSDQRQMELVAGQSPIATVFGCVDSRVPVEQIFDHHAGDLLIVRTAGQTLAGSATGSIEFGVRALGVPLVAVLGHTGCGAVAAALNDDHPGGHLGALVDEVAERLEPTFASDPLAATKANVAATVAALRAQEALLLPDGSAPSIVGLLYDLATSEVSVLDADGLDPS